MLTLVCILFLMMIVVFNCCVLSCIADQISRAFLVSHRNGYYILKSFENCKLMN